MLAKCAECFDHSPTTMECHLKIIDDSHPKLMIDMQLKKYDLSDADLIRLFIDENLDIKTISELQGVHYNVIRKHVRRLGLKKDRKSVARSMSARHIRQHGCRHPIQRPDIMAKMRRSTARINYNDKQGREHYFRSLHELGYAMLLDSLELEWYHAEMVVPYVDMLIGKQRVYTIDFTVIRGDFVEWVEVKPNAAMIPEDRRVYASRRAEAAGIIYRGLTDHELYQISKVLAGPLNGVSFVYSKPRAITKRIVYYFPSRSAALRHKLDGWCGAAPKRIGGELWSRDFLKLK